MTTRADLHRIIDALPETLLDEALRACDPWSRAHDEAAYDDEPLSASEVEALERWERGERTGRTWTEEEFLASLRAGEAVVG